MAVKPSRPRICHLVKIGSVFARLDLDPLVGPLPSGRYALGVYVVKKLGTPARYTFFDFGRIYYPRVYDPNLAQPIEVAEGTEVKNLKLETPY